VVTYTRGMVVVRPPNEFTLTSVRVVSVMGEGKGALQMRQAGTHTHGRKRRGDGRKCGSPRLRLDSNCGTVGPLRENHKRRYQNYGATDVDAALTFATGTIGTDDAGTYISDRKTVSK
jgi:hypothetical protein